MLPGAKTPFPFFELGLYLQFSAGGATSLSLLVHSFDMEKKRASACRRGARTRLHAGLILKCVSGAGSSQWLRIFQGRSLLHQSLLCSLHLECDRFSTAERKQAASPVVTADAKLCLPSRHKISPNLNPVRHRTTLTHMHTPTLIPSWHGIEKVPASPFLFKGKSMMHKFSLIFLVCDLSLHWAWHRRIVPKKKKSSI
jgi:hypothetical protein